MEVSIVGLSSSTRHMVPEDSEIWALPWDNEFSAKASKLFEMHDRGLLERPESLRDPDYFEKLAEMPQPIIMQRSWSDIPSSVAFPLDELVETVFKGFPRGAWSDQIDWYNSSPAYMIALAIHEGAEKIGLYGIDVKDHSEFSYESPCLEYLIGLAVGKGINVVLPEGPTDLNRFRGVGIKLGEMQPVYNLRYGFL